jgi:methylmalonyl-CoA/ethylmalonyl-CoA epimerase
MINKIDHIGIAVNNLDEALKRYTEQLGLSLDEIETGGDDKTIKAAIIEVGGSKIELLESNDPDSAIGKFLARRGEGIHHLAVGVDDIRATMAELKAKGLPFIDKEPRPGTSGTSIAFIHPKGAKILLELVQHNE